MNEKERMLKCLSAAQFAAWEARLFLDTHPNCERALAAYCDYSAKAATLKEKFESRFCPLSSGIEIDGKWSWVCDPWPWDYVG